MVRTPARSCPNLSRLIDDAESELLAAFFRAKTFENLKWLAKYGAWHSEGSQTAPAAEMLAKEKKDRLGPLEIEATRIATIAGTRGQFALEGFARSKLPPDRAQVLMSRRDELARSLWAFTNETALFEATENSLHMRLYRRYDTHYQTFMVESARAGHPRSGDDALQPLLDKLTAELDRGDGYNIDRFDIPAEGEDPPAEMYLIFHPNPPTSVQMLDDFGNRSKFYYRPPGVAMIVYEPSTGRVHVRAGNRTLRHVVAERFCETVLDRPISRQPVDFQAYDITRFFSGFELTTPAYEDVVVLRSRLVRVDISIGNLANRLSVSTTIDQDISALIDGQPGLQKAFERAVAVRLIEIAVRYRRVVGDDERTLDFTVTDRNTSSLFSLEDPFERALGHRLLREWDILREGRAASAIETAAVLPALLALWNQRADRVTGAWLQNRSVAASLLIELGFLVPVGWEGDELVEDEAGLGPMGLEVVPGPGRADLKATEGWEAPAGSPDRYRVYRVRNGWVAQHLSKSIAGVFDALAVAELSPDLLSLGTLQIDTQDVPVYLARGLDDERVRDSVDTQLRARHALGIGLVLHAGGAIGTCLAANVMTPIVDHLVGDGSEILLSADRLQQVFRRDQSLARGGLTVAFVRFGDSGGTLFIPGKGSISVSGDNRITVIQRLVDAHNAGPAPMATGELIKGFEGQSLANIFGPFWDKLKGEFIRSPKKGLWEIAA